MDRQLISANLSETDAWPAFVASLAMRRVVALVHIEKIPTGIDLIASDGKYRHVKTYGGAPLVTVAAASSKPFFDSETGFSIT